jgi:hypothetical protein
MKRFLVLFLALVLTSSLAWAGFGEDPGDPDLVFCEPASAGNLDTLYIPPNPSLWPWDVNVDIMISTDNGISGVSVPLVDLCYDGTTMPTYLDPNKNDPDSVTPNAYTGSAIEGFSIVALNLYGVSPTLSPPNFLIGAVHFTDSFGVTGTFNDFLLAHLTFTVANPGCLCLDVIDGAFQPGGATFSMTTPGAVTYVPGFDEPSCCFQIAERFNNPPDLDCPTDVEGFGGDIVPVSVSFSDPDGDAVVSYTITPDCGTIENEVFTATTLSFDWNTEGCTAETGIIEVCVTDEFGGEACCDINFTLIYAAGFVTIAQDDFALIGDLVYLPVYLQNFVPFGGFKILNEWDPNVLTLHDVIRGDCINEIDFYLGPHNPHYKFEKFMYEWLPCTDIHKKKIKVVGIADMPDGYQGYPIDVHQEPCVLYYLVFEVKNDATLKGFKLPVIFEWDVGIWDENTFSDPTGYIWYVSADPEQFPHDPTGPNYEIRKLMYFYNGGIRVDDTGLQWRGDVNLNEYAYEIADAVCFANYFITGYLCTYGQEGITDYWYEISIEATDVTADGIVLSIADLVYMIRIIMEMEAPIVTKAAPVAEVASVTAQVKDRSVVVSSDCDANIGAAAFVFKHSGSVADVKNLSSMDLKWNDADGKLRVLVWSPEANFVPAGASDLFSFEAEGVELIGVEAADDMGRALKGDVFTQVIPKAFALKGNYPNPFNPTTNVAFALPEAGNVSLNIYNITGQLVWSHSSWYGAGEHVITWHGKNSAGDDVASGIYFYRLQAGDFNAMRRMLIVK